MGIAMRLRTIPQGAMHRGLTPPSTREHVEIVWTPCMTTPNHCCVAQTQALYSFACEPSQ